MIQQFEIGPSLSSTSHSLLSNMSAYGAIKTPEKTVRLAPRTYPLAAEGPALTCFPVRR